MSNVELEPPPNKVEDFKYEWKNWLYRLWDYVTRGLICPKPTSADIFNSRGTTSSTVSDMQTLLDGNIYLLDEVSGVPGMDLRVTFTSLKRIKGIIFNGYYDNGAVNTHYVQIELYNYTTESWDAFMDVTDSLATNYRYIEIPSDANYLQNGTAVVRFYHPVSGTPGHDLYIDYITLFR